MGKLWQEVEQSHLPKLKHYARHLRWAASDRTAFNTAFGGVLPDLQQETNDILSRLLAPGVGYNEGNRRFTGGQLFLDTTLYGEPIPEHQHFLNEARLSAIGLAVYFASLLVSIPAPTPGAPPHPKLLVLDDVLIGLDMANRLPVLKLIREVFADWQIVLMTHDRVWFDLIRENTKPAGVWWDRLPEPQHGKATVPSGRLPSAASAQSDAPKVGDAAPDFFNARFWSVAVKRARRRNLSGKRFFDRFPCFARLKNDMMSCMAEMTEDSHPTRPSLLRRVKNTDDAQAWEEFNDFYGPLIFRFAVGAGLTETEAQEVVQETLIAAARNLPGFRYDPTVCAFKTWLLNLSRWRVTDQLRKRGAVPPRSKARGDGTSRTATIDRQPDLAVSELEQIWEKEWRETLLERALQRVKQQVPARQWQIYDLYVLKQWPAADVARSLRVNVARVYLAKHRLGRLLQEELRREEARGV